MRCSPSRAITYHQALIISAPARAFPRPRGSFGNALSKASQWKICKGFGLVTIKLSKYRAWNRKNNDILPDPFNKDPLLGPYIEGPLSGHSLRRSSYFLKTALLSIFVSPGWVVLHYFLFLLWGEAKLLLLLIENLFLGQSYPFYDLQRIIWLKVSSKVAQGIYELTRGMTRGIPSSIPSFLEDLFVRFHLPWFTISQAHI